MSDSYDELPHRDIVMDWTAYAGLPSVEKESFLELATSIEKGGWFHRDSYAPPDWAVVDMSEYTDYEDYVKALKKAGPSFYEGRKAEKRGFYTKFFDEQTYIADIVAIDSSATERQGKPMFDSYLRPVEQRGGYPTEYREAQVPTQGVYWLRKFGTFRASPGYQQGPVIVNEQLVSYLSIRCFANFANYNLLIGHKEFLRDGVVHKMHLDFVKAILEARNQLAAGIDTADRSLAGVRYIGYGTFIGTYPGLKRWKKSTLFKPALFKFDYTPALADMEAPA